VTGGGVVITEMVIYEIESLVKFKISVINRRNITTNFSTGYSVFIFCQ
jgi:hypothetical protein